MCSLLAAAALATLHRPDKLNPLSSQTLREIVEAARWFDRHALVKVVVVSGQGRSFSAGADISGSDAPAEGSPLRERGPRPAHRPRRRGDERGHCRSHPRPLHRRRSRARRRLPPPDRSERRLLLDPRGRPRHSTARGGFPRPVRDIGPALTKELVMTCRAFTSDEALAAGFLNRVVPAAGLDQAVEDLVARSRSRH